MVVKNHDFFKKYKKSDLFDLNQIFLIFLSMKFKKSQIHKNLGKKNHF